MQNYFKRYSLPITIGSIAVFIFVFGEYDPSVLPDNVRAKCLNANTQQGTCRGYHLLIWVEHVVSHLKDTLTLLVAIFAAAIAAILMNISRTQTQHFATAERAYVKMSHAPPGIDFLSSTEIEVIIEVANKGHTPASISNVVLNVVTVDKMANMPAIPDYSDAKPRSGAFLAKDDLFYTTRRLELPAGARVKAERGALQICLVGYVDYQDNFGNRHRSGYARKFSHKKHASEGSVTNLYIFGGVRYNYDRVRVPGEGNDWNTNVIADPN